MDVTAHSPQISLIGPLLPLEVRLVVVCRAPSGSVSEGALQQTLAAAAGWTFVLLAEPVHHVTGVSSMTAAQAEVRGAAYGNMTDGALEGETLADSTLSATSLTATVTAVHTKFCRETTQRTGWLSATPQSLSQTHKNSQLIIQTSSQGVGSESQSVWTHSKLSHILLHLTSPLIPLFHCCLPAMWLSLQFVTH